MEDIHFSLKKGEKIAIVGSSGSGKSTLVDLLARFYDVSKGSITIDGVDIKDIKISDLRSLMGMVTQEPILFNDSIRRNIEFGSKTYSDEMIWTILDTAYASDFVREGNRGLDYNIGDRGSKLSGGQRQRLTLARAILRNPAILILDWLLHGALVAIILLQQQILTLKSTALVAAPKYNFPKYRKRK